LGETYEFINKEMFKGSQEFKITVGKVISKPISNKAELNLKEPKIGVVNNPLDCHKRERKANLYPLEIVLPKSLSAFKDDLHYETIIDGKIRWFYRECSCCLFEPGTSWRGKAVDEIVYFCDGREQVHPAYLTAGSHTVQMKAYFPGTDIKLISE